jgi:hypothetical protein
MMLVSGDFENLPPTHQFYNFGQHCKILAEARFDVVNVGVYLL